MNQSQKEVLIITALIIGAISTRFLFLINGEALLPNFTAVGAIAIFGACYFTGKFKFIIPIIVLWLSDLILNNVIYSRYYDHFQIFGNPWVYAGFIMAGILAYFLMKKSSWPRLFVTSIGTGILFFLISNFGVWLGSTTYSQDMTGLMACYTAGIPFFRNTLIGNVFYSFLLFGIYEYIIAHYFNFRKLIAIKVRN